MYSVGDKIKYMTSTVRTQNGEKLGEVKVGVVAEAFSTVDNNPCYWVEGEKELILGSQIIGKVVPEMLEYTTFFGATENVLPKLDMYSENNNLYVGLDFLDPDCDCWLPYTDVTVNVGDLPFLESAIDTTNNGNQIIDFLIKNGFGELTGEAIPSGYCVFPVFKFNEEKLKEIDEFSFKAYAKANNMPQREQRPLDEAIDEAASHQKEKGPSEKHKEDLER